ncbi:MAG: DUF1667 domain-containing protein [Candidatus Omnitrophica bacterium]|nr:DUF1667 domain-containing protein [Candidatus Omnitrophota bacterium]MBU4478968.1 DUF1667 domain-containing protein [Candidatus Omnitrophota bacterium]MCG2703759.1 DUF1667 domain-containing protein [Candidatus Omnitrophota bacterium]
MNKRLTCIECPRGCVLSIEIENGKIVSLKGNECPKGEKYAAAEVENPLRILTSAVLAEGLDLKMVAVRTDKPIPKAKLFAAMEEIKKIRLSHPVRCGEVIAENFLGLGVRLLATRRALKES